MPYGVVGARLRATAAKGWAPPTSVDAVYSLTGMARHRTEFIHRAQVTQPHRFSIGVGINSLVTATA